MCEVLEASLFYSNETGCHTACFKVHCRESAVHLVCLVHLIFTLNAEWSQGQGALGIRGVES